MCSSVPVKFLFRMNSSLSPFQEPHRFTVSGHLILFVVRVPLCYLHLGVGTCVSVTSLDTLSCLPSVALLRLLLLPDRPLCSCSSSFQSSTEHIHGHSAACCPARLHLQLCPCHHHWLHPLALFRSGLLSVPVLRGLRLTRPCMWGCLPRPCLFLAPGLHHFPCHCFWFSTCTHARSDPACSNFVHLDLFMCLQHPQRFLHFSIKVTVHAVHIHRCWLVRLRFLHESAWSRTNITLDLRSWQQYPTNLVSSQ